MNSLISIRIDPKTKKAAQKTLGELGLDLSAGVTLFLEQVIETESIPFTIATKRGHKLRNERSLRGEINWALKHGKGYKTAEEMHADILKG
ncbi:MAG: type II toxin-antitoxin system RelB/DinJ family antitoxin [bacterium]|nr:type II toxin-antitoxin system RelB/DinJ family antitoxin [bacterium]